MKKFLSCVLLLGIVAGTLKADDSDCQSGCKCNHVAKSYLSIRPQFQSVSPEYVSAFRNDRLHARPDGIGGALQFVLFGGRTTRRDDLARYFLPNCSTSFIVDEQLGDTFDVKGDVRAEHLNIFTVEGNFRSKVTIAPVQSTVGFGVHYRQAFWQNDECGRGFWGSISFPIQHVRNNLNFCEDVEEFGGGANEAAAPVVVADATEAFSQQAWQYGKMTKCSLKETSVGDVELKLGYEWLEHDPCHVEGYVGILAPTGNRPEGIYVFEPIVGNGKHWGLMVGGAMGVTVWSDEGEDRYLRIECASHAEYLFKKKQTRSFDLKNRPWSRYMLVYNDQENAQEVSNQQSPDFAANTGTPGINVFTQQVNVRPGYWVDYNAAFVYTSCGFQGEVGANVYARRSECVELACPWQEGPALKTRTGDGQTNPIRTIDGNYFIEQAFVDGSGSNPSLPVSLDDYDVSIIKLSDLDLNTATAPCGISYTIYGALGYRFDECEYPMFVNGGASYEFSPKDASMVDRWAVWAKCGFSF